jgi:AAA ATPase domain
MSCNFWYCCRVAANPYSPGVGARPPFLAGRDKEIRQFEQLLVAYPEKRRNLRVTGLRGVGKTVLLKEYDRIARRHDWVVVRRDWSGRLCNEADFATAVAEHLRGAVEELSVKARVKRGVTTALEAISRVQVTIGGAVTLSVAPGAPRSAQSVLEERLRVALTEVGNVAREQRRGVALLYDEAHSVRDQPEKGQYPLGALLSALVAAQDDDDDPLPVMLVLCGLHPLTRNIREARSNAERLFRASRIGNLSLTPVPPEPLSAAAQALVRPVSDIGYADGVAERVARDVDGYPYFIQWFGESLWEAADIQGLDVIGEELYERERSAIQQSLDEEFFVPRYRDARQADQRTLRAAASLGGEHFTKAELDAVERRSSNALSQSLKRLIADHLVYRDEHGVYAYTAPMFGDFLRRCYPRLPDDK